MGRARRVVRKFVLHPPPPPPPPPSKQERIKDLYLLRFEVDDDWNRWERLDGTIRELKKEIARKMIYKALVSEAFDKNLMRAKEEAVKLVDDFQMNPEEMWGFWDWVDEVESTK
jgi:hypothetical protein